MQGWEMGTIVGRTDSLELSPTEGSCKWGVSVQWMLCSVLLCAEEGGKPVKQDTLIWGKRFRSYS